MGWPSLLEDILDKINETVASFVRSKPKSDDLLNWGPDPPAPPNPYSLRDRYIQASELANELGVKPIIVMNEAGRKGFKIESPSEGIPLVIAGRIREYILWERKQKERRLPRRRT
jgi:hypothetical protein